MMRRQNRYIFYHPNNTLSSISPFDPYRFPNGSSPQKTIYFRPNGVNSIYYGNGMSFNSNVLYERPNRYNVTRYPAITRSLEILNLGLSN